MKLLLACIFSIACACTFPTSLYAQASPTPVKSKLSGKVYIINLEQGQQFFSYVVKDLKTCSIESLVFLCGTQLEDSWLAGKKILIPNNSIKSLYEFEDLDDYRESLKDMQNAAQKVQAK